MTFLSVIIPAYNEEKRISETLEIIETYLSKQNYKSEILVVDDGSKDNTVNIVKDFSNKNPCIKLHQNPGNQGKGAAVKRGMLNALGKYRLFSDADLSAPIVELERLLKWALQGYDVVIGSRNIPDPDVKIEALLKRKIIGRIFNLIVQILILPKFHDTQCGFKLFSAESAMKIFSLQKLSGFSFDVEILYLAEKLNYKIKEVPVNWHHVPASKVSIIKDSIRMFNDIINIKSIHRETFKNNYKN